MRLYSGAGLSTLDLFTDVYMIYTYLTTPGQEMFGRSLLVMVSVCMFCQTCIVWIQHRKRPKVALLKEMLVVLSGIKVRPPSHTSLLFFVFAHPLPSPAP
jgi:hypothetical protein